MTVRRRNALLMCALVLLAAVGGPNAQTAPQERPPPVTLRVAEAIGVSESGGQTPGAEFGIEEGLVVADLVSLLLGQSLNQGESISVTDAASVTPQPVDADGDGFDSTKDCNDKDPAINPGAKEVPGNDVDENCDGVIEPSPPVDEDGDGFDSTKDCNDKDPAIHPGAQEIPNNNVDENCDGVLG